MFVIRDQYHFFMSFIRFWRDLSANGLMSAEAEILSTG
jgi:hypothetical protein